MSYWSGGAVPSPSMAYSDSSSSYSPGSVSSMSVISSSVYSPDSSSLSAATNHCINGNGRPYLEVIEQTAPQFRFRYKSEMQGTHGAIQGVMSKKKNKTFPTVRLCNFAGSAVIRCTLYTADKKSLHVHRLVGKSSGKEKEDPHDICVGPHAPNGYTACFQNLVIIHVAKKHLVGELLQKKKRVFQANHPCSPESSVSIDVLATMKKEAEEETKNMDMNCAVLKFEALVFENDHYVPIPFCDPVYSNSIKNLKCHVHGQLKICRMDRVSGSCEGGEEVFLLVEKVGKDNIRVVMTEYDEYGKEVWSDYCKFSALDVHHQFAIVCRTPKYRFTDIKEKISVDMQLERITDGARSEPREFSYSPRENYSYQITESNKRKRVAVDRFPSPQQQLDVTSTTLELSVPVQTHCDVMPMSNVVYPLVTNENVQRNSNSVMWPPFDYLQLQNEDNIYQNGGEDMMTERSSSITRLLNTLPTPDESQMNDYFNPNSIRNTLVTENILQEPTGNNWLVFDGCKDTKCATVTLDKNSGIVTSSAESVGKEIRMEETYKETGKMAKPSLHNLASTTLEKLNCLVNNVCNNKYPAAGNSNPMPNAVSDTSDDSSLSDDIDNLFMMSIVDGYSALHAAVIHKQVDQLHALIGFLQQYNKIDLINCRTAMHQTPLHLAAAYFDTGDVNVQIVNALLDAGADPSKVDLVGRSPLHVAAKSNFKPVIAALLQSPLTDIDGVSDDDGTALHMVAERNQVELADLLLDSGANVNCINKKTGRTPLHVAVINKNPEIVHLLLRQENIQINKEDFNSRSPLDLISDECHSWSKIYQQLIKHSAILPEEWVTDIKKEKPDDQIIELLPKFLQMVISSDRPQLTA